MTPDAFIAKWRGNRLSERAGAQTFFNDLCELLGVEEPNDPENYCFERGATRTGAGRGWADVWKRACFAWENKAPGSDLGKALRQLMTYALALDNPPLLVVCDRERIEIHTHFTGAPSRVHVIRLEDIGEPENLKRLRWVFEDPQRFHPGTTRHDITAEAARRVAEIAQRLRERGHAPEPVAHFLDRCLFCLFAEDAGLLPGQLFERLVTKSQGDPAKLTARLGELFRAMGSGGDFALEDIQWFNGGLFAEADALPLEKPDIDVLLHVSRLDWSAIDPSIFGTLFERGLDPGKRSQLGAHYTDPATILRLVEPTVVAPLTEEWNAAKAEIAAQLAKSKKHGDKAHRAAEARFAQWLERLKGFRVLDPACGSGNFLYLALKALKDIEHRANLEAEALGLQRPLLLQTSPANVMGIELNPYAAELARLTVWIGELQWLLAHGYEIVRNPILRPLDHIECRDAILWTDYEGVVMADMEMDRDSMLVAAFEADWPACDVIIGNPPFLGDKKMRRELGSEYTAALRKCYAGRVPGGADLVTYWFEKARGQIQAGKAKLAGLVATNSIRGGANRRVLDRITESTRIFEAWSDEPWVNEGAAVRVSLVCFGDWPGAKLGSRKVREIYSDLTAEKEVDLALSRPLPENRGAAFNGIQKTGPFDIDGDRARGWLLKGGNPNGRPNSDVLAPYRNGIDVARRSRDVWVLDFGCEMTADEAALFEGPFEYAQQVVLPVRSMNMVEALRRDWWKLWRPRPEMRRCICLLPRYIVTPEVSKYRVFTWLPSTVLPDKNLIAIARTDDTTFGILHSRFHELWALRLGTSLEDRPRYTPTTTFETFPFPPGLTPNLKPEEYSNPHAEAIAAAARRLNELRENWLNPPEWVDRVPEVVPGYPDRIIPKPEHAAELKKRTLTHLYNARPAWLDHAHRELDRAVAAAYGWPDYTPDMPDDAILRRLLALNLERAAAQR